MKLTTIISTFCLLCLLCIQPAYADGGFWLPTQIQGKVHQTMKKQGLRLSEKDIYDINQSCLSNAILSLSYDDSTFSPFASASFISGEGLVLTNFHCVARYLEHISNADHDYVKHGCWATHRNEETYLPNLQINQLIAVKDVTTEITRDTENLTDQALTQKINENGKQIVKTEAKGRGVEGKVYSLFGGGQYILAVFRSFKDVRIVAAPPISIGKFGGDTDNWQWPRYSADFAILRVYANDKNQPAAYNKQNRPYQPDAHLSISTKGVKADDFVMVAGYPAQTRQYVPSFALEKIVFKDTQAEADIAKIKLDFYTQRKETATDSLYSYYNIKAGGAANIYLKSIGEINGVKEAGIIARKQQEEQAMTDWILSDNDHTQRYGTTLLDDMKANYERLTILNFTDQMFREVALYGANVIPFAGKFEKLVQMEQRKSKNVKTAMKGEIRKLKPLAVGFYRDFRPEDDKYIMKKLLAYYLEHVDSTFYSTALKKVEKHYPQHLSTYIDSLYDHSPLRNQESMLALLDSVPTQGTAALSQDGLYQLSLGFYRMYVEKINRLKQTYQNKNMKLYSLYLQAYAEKNKGKLLSFDANRTLRYSIGKVKAAAPSEGVIYTPFTTVNGMVSRHRLYSGNKDFNLPSRFVKLIEQRQPSKYFDQKVTPTCCFLTDAHTTSGSSGSPVLNSKGEVVGINFDRIWQGLSSDYETGANEKSRNIVVDIRYVLWTLEQYSRSQYVLDELDIH